MKKLKIYVFASDYNEIHYLKLQIKSFKKNFLTGNEELIVVNGSSTNKEEVDNLCKENNIQCIEYDNSLSIYGSRPHLNKCFGFYKFLTNEIQKSNDYIMSLHTDMFFLKPLNYEELFNKKCFWFIPRYHDGLFYVWEGIFMIDCEKFNEKGYGEFFDMSGIIPLGDGCSVSHYSLQKMDKNDFGYFEFWNLGETDGINYDTHLSGHKRYSFNVNERIVRDYYDGSGLRMGNKTYEYEDNIENYHEYYIKNFERIKEKYPDKFDFPKPMNFDVVSVYGNPTEEFLIHFKSGSGYQHYYSENYRIIKLECLDKVIESQNKK